MLKITPLAILSAIAFQWLAPSAHASDDPARIADGMIGEDMGKLTDAQKKRVFATLHRLKNTKGCAGTLAHCMAQGDVTARRHAGYVVRMIRKNKTDKFISAGITLRHQSAFPEEVQRIESTGHPTKGPATAPVVITEFACFQCPFCAHLAPQLKGLHSRFKGKISHTFKFYPVRSHARGVASSLAGLAAHRQGKFWPMHDLMFEHRADLSDEDLADYAKRIGLDVTRFKAALADPTAMRFIERDKLEGMRLGVEGTPTFFINGKLYQGANDFAEIADRIAEEIDIVEGRIK